jgi:glucose-1-phosphate cytidylyltransferase
MKVVIFCGGLGVRMGEATERTPKPMIHVGNQPILWHIMKYYAMWGHSEFILCLGHKGEQVKQYFLAYNEALVNDFTLSQSGRQIDLVHSDIDDWRITFVDTGHDAKIGERLKRVEPYLGDDPTFLATYGDGLTDVPVQAMVDHFEQRNKLAMFLSVRPSINMHVVEADDDGLVRDIENIRRSRVRINGGFFVLRREVLDMIEPGDELVERPFRQLIEMEQLIAYRYEGFWAAMDTLKDKQYLDSLIASGITPWLSTDPTAGVPEYLA